MNRSLLSRLVAVLALLVVFMASQAGAQTYPVTSGDLQLGDSSPASSNLIAGASITLAGSGYKPGATITITIESDPVTLGTAIADATGAFTFSGAIPADFSNGSHTIKAAGQSNDGTLVLTQPVDITGGTPEELAFTGTSSMVAVILALSLTGAGGVLIAISRRSRLA